MGRGFAIIAIAIAASMICNFVSSSARADDITASGAALRGLKVIVPVDGLSANDLYAEQLTVWQLANGPRFGGQVTITKSDMIEF